MSISSGFLRAPPTSVQMSHTKWSWFIKKSLLSSILKAWFIGLALFATVTWEEKVEAPSSGFECISDCSTCPAICSPPPPPTITKPLPSAPPPSHKPQLPPPPSSHSSGIAPPPPPFKSYNTPPAGLAQPQPTFTSEPHDFSYPYYYFYASAASSPSTGAPFFVLILGILLLATSSFVL